MLTQSVSYTSLENHYVQSFQKYILDSVSSSLSWSQFISSISHTERLAKSTDQSTTFHKALYSGFDTSSFSSSDFYQSYLSCIQSIYSNFVSHLVPSHLCAVQRFPTFRFHFPGNISVFEFHRDSDYSHPLSEINCFVALTDCVDSSALQIERHLGCDDFYPLNLRSGQVAILNTSIFRHGDVVNTTDSTRVSFDFRFVPISSLSVSSVSLSSKRKFSLDSYFMPLPVK